MQIICRERAGHARCGTLVMRVWSLLVRARSVTSGCAWTLRCSSGWSVLFMLLAILGCATGVTLGYGMRGGETQSELGRPLHCGRGMHVMGLLRDVPVLLAVWLYRAIARDRRETDQRDQPVWELT